MTPSEWATAGLTVIRTFGRHGLAHRARFELRKRLHRLMDAPTPVTDVVRRAELPRTWPFRPDVTRIRSAADSGEAISRAGRVCGGEYQRYRWTWSRLPTCAADWIRHPESGYRYPNQRPWYHIAHLDDHAGDIKDVWDAARFGWAFDLARGWILTSDERYAAFFSHALNDFLDSSPPFRGVHWSCGQETAIRAIALLWMEAAFDEAASFDEHTRQRAREALAWSAERIEDAIDYAISQRNNHGLSEATGLVAIGVRLRGKDERAESWIAQGSRHLNRLVRDQFATDGWYIQHSFAYMRLALDQLVIARRALRHVGRDLATDCLERIRAGINLLNACIDPKNGNVPNHGANDGSFVLPLTTRPYGDFRPSLTAAAATFEVPLSSAIECDPEVLSWLSEREPRRHETPSIPRVTSGTSGWAIAETGSARIFARAAHYRSRPGHIDPAHLDIWIRGAKQSIDAGTFRYLAPPPWRNGLADIDVHNTLSIEGLPVAVRGPRFLWLRWPSARIVTAALGDDGDVRIVIENDSWKNAGISHRRICHIRGTSVLVVDELHAPVTFDRTVRIHWLLEEGAEVAMRSSADGRLVEQPGVEGSTVGWAAEGYGARRSVRSVRLEVRPLRGQLQVVSAFGDASPVMESRIESPAAIAHVS